MEWKEKIQKFLELDKLTKLQMWTLCAIDAFIYCLEYFY